MKGTILDFLKLASEKPELSRELVELAAKYDFTFTDELSDDQLEGVAGGFSFLSSYNPVTFSQPSSDPSPIIGVPSGGMPKPPSPAPGP